MSWVAGRQMFPYEKTEEEILPLVCPERGFLDGLWNCWLVWQRKLVTWFQKAHSFCFSRLMMVWSWVSLLVSLSVTFVICKLVAVIPGCWDNLREFTWLSWCIRSAQWRFHSLPILFPVYSSVERLERFCDLPKVSHINGESMTGLPLFCLESGRTGIRV